MLEVSVVESEFDGSWNACFQETCVGDDAWRIRVEGASADSSMLELDGSAHLEDTFWVWMDPEAQRFLVVDETGSIHYSDDSETWTAATVPGEGSPVNFGLSPDGTLLLFAADAIWASDDDGQVWSVVADTVPNYRQVRRGGGGDYYYAVGDSGRVWRSSTSEFSWEELETPFDDNLRALVAQWELRVAGVDGLVASLDPEDSTWVVERIADGPELRALAQHRGSSSWDALFAVGDGPHLYYKLGRYEWEVMDSQLGPGGAGAMGITNRDHESGGVEYSLLLGGHGGAASIAEVIVRDSVPAGCGVLD